MHGSTTLYTHLLVAGDPQGYLDFITAIQTAAKMTTVPPATMTVTPAASCTTTRSLTNSVACTTARSAAHTQPGLNILNILSILNRDSARPGFILGGTFQRKDIS